MSTKTLNQPPKIIRDSITFDDVLLVPSYSEVLPNMVDVSTFLTSKIKLNLPLLSAAMDTVTEHQMAIALAKLGGLGIIHKNLSIDEQANQVRKVKKYETGIVRDPAYIKLTTTLAEIESMADELGYCSFPVVDDEINLLGILTSRDIRFADDKNMPAHMLMTPKEKLIYVEEKDIANKEKVKQLLHKHKIEKILVVDTSFKLKGLITLSDLVKAKEDPLASKDQSGRLRAGAAVGTDKASRQRIEALIAAEVDVIVVDTAHGHSKFVLDTVKEVRSLYKDINIIAGNIATAEAAIALHKAGADAVKIGIGPGSICTTRVVTGVGVPQITAIMEVYSALAGTDTKIIADGGMRFSGDIAKALAVGADCAMVGNIFAGTEESPGEVEIYQGRSYKNYRGMGSMSAMSGKFGSKDRYFQSAEKDNQKLVPEGIEGRVPYKGLLKHTVHQLIGGIKASMGYTGCHTIKDFHEKAQFTKITTASMRESHVHDVTITREAPNYHMSE